MVDEGLAELWSAVQLGDGIDTGGTGVAGKHVVEGGQHGQQRRADVFGERELVRIGKHGAQGVQNEFPLGRPAPVQGGLAGLHALGDRHTEAQFGSE